MSKPTTGDAARVQRFSRDTADLPARLSAWLAPQLGSPADVVVHSGVDANGFSAETVIVGIASTDSAGRTTANKFVLRIEPDRADIPMLPSYRLDHQFQLMRTVAEQTVIPVPAARWLEPTGDVIGTPFFLMDYVAGRVPPDVLPYTFGGNWFADAAPEEQRALQDRTVQVLVRLHAIPEPDAQFSYLVEGSQTGRSPLRARVDQIKSWYDFATAEIGPIPLLERGFDWLESHWPTTAEAASAPVLCWGDARIGNVVYDDFTPAAVLDWEIATVGPRELDVAWFIYSHQVWEEVAHLAGLPGLPHVLREDDVRATYLQHSGVELGDLHWFYVLSSVLWGVFMTRGSHRRIHFGEMDTPDNVEDLLYHATSLRSLIGQAR